MTDNVEYLDAKARLKHEPTFRNLMSLAAASPKAAIEEITDTTSIASLMNERECIIYLLGQLAGLCSRSHYASHVKAMNELDERLRKYWRDGEFDYRRMTFEREQE